LKNKLITLFFLLVFVPVQSQTWDARLLHSLSTKHTTAADGYFNFLTKTNSAVVALTPASIGIAGLIRKDKPMMYNAGTIVMAGALNLAVVMSLKYTVNRTRPYKEYPGYIFNKDTDPTPSFPSGHTSSAFANATALSLVYPKWYIIVPAYTWAGSVGYSRLHLGVHYPSDVILGALIGAGCAYISFKGNQWLSKKYKYLGD
jgi:undecaprenyl-diphosphatase